MPQFYLSLSLNLSMDVLHGQHFLNKEPQETSSHVDANVPSHPPFKSCIGWKWWLLVSLSITFLLSGQTVGTLVGRFYYDEGGDSIWLATLVQSAGFPILFLPLLLLPPSTSTATTTSMNPPSIATLAFLYISLGVLIAGDNLLYSYGLLYLPVSTFSLVCATQLAFNALFSFYINSQKLTPFILNSLVLLTLSASLVALRKDSEESNRVSTGKHVIGFICTLGASAGYSLLLSLTQYSFDNILKMDTHSVILEMQIYPSAVATCVCLVGLFASGEWKNLTGEMDGFGPGKVSYVMALVWTAVAWQVSSIGYLGVIFLVSSLFCNVISTLTLPAVPVVAVIFYHEKLDGVKVVAMLMAIWGFLSYIYQQYLDDDKSKKTMTDLNEIS